MLDEWLTSYAFSRSVRHAPRDFSDAVLLAELLAQLLPAGAVALHNYPSTGRLQQKLINWDVLNRKVLTPIHCELSRQQMEDLAGASPGAISVLLVRVKQQIDKPASTRALGKPPRSPTKKPSHRVTNGPSAPPLMLQAARSVPKLKSSPSSFSSRPQQATRVTEKSSGFRSPSATSPTAKPMRTLSPAQSAPSTPRNSSSLKRNISPARSPYWLHDYLPMANERPAPEALPSTFARVLQKTTVPRRTEANPVQGPRSPRGLSVRSPAASSVDLYQGCPYSRQLSNEPQSLRYELSLSSVRPERSCLRVHVDQSLVSSLSSTEEQPSEICEGSFVRLNSPDGDEEEHLSLARVVRNLPSGDCLLQLFKPLLSHEAISSNDEKPRPASFVSTPHFIECCSSQLQAVNGIRYDSVTRAWAVGPHYSSGQALMASPTYPKPSSPLCQYTTTVLSRHKFSAVASQTPLKLRVVEPERDIATSGAAVQPPTAPEESDPLFELQEELCAKPTVFAPVQVDLSLVLDSLPPRYPPSSKRKSQAP